MVHNALSPDDPALPMHYPGFAFRSLRDDGIPAAALLDGTGLTETLLRDPNHRSDFAALHRFYLNVLEASGDPHIGVRLALRFRASYIGLPFFAAMNAESFEAAIRTLARFLRLTFPAIAFEGPIGHDDEAAGTCAVCIRPTWPLGNIAYFGTSSALIVCDGLFKALLQRPHITLRGDLVVPEPDGWARVADEIPFPVRFGADRNLLVFPRHMLGEPLPTHDPLNLRQLLHLCDQFVEDMRPDDRFEGLVLRYFGESGNFSATGAQVAGALGLSARGLRRRLAQTGTSYRQLQQQARYNKARQLLADPTRPVKSIAFELGFDTPSNFARSFKQWSGVAPTGYRSGAPAIDPDGQN